MRTRKGSTLIEVMVLAAIISILITILFPVAIGCHFLEVHGLRQGKPWVD